MTTTDTTMLDAALALLDRSITPVPVRARSKKPYTDHPEGKGWQNLRITPETAPHFFNGRPGNIGALLGMPLADGDMDCPEAVVAARYLMPETSMKFGRKTAPCSHLEYFVDPPIPSEEFKDPADGAMLVELRCLKRDGSVGRQTVFPPSIHEETGETIRYEDGFDGHPANVEAAEIQRAMRRVAAAALLARHWPAAGHGRHECELALAGVLARAGWTADEAAKFVLATYSAVSTHDRTKLDRVRESVRSTFAKRGGDIEFTGVPRLMALVGDATVKTALKWLGIEQKPRAQATAQSEGASADWKSLLICNGYHQPQRLLANCVTALRNSPEWAGAVGYNEFAAKITVERPLPWGEPAGATWSDQHDRKFTEWLQHQGILVPSKTAGEGVQTVAMERPYHPCRGYLRGLVWDSTGRIDCWLTRYLGVQPSTYASKIGRRWLVSAVARILQPGAKADAVLVLEGAQGIGKSTTGRILFDPWFCDHLPELSSKDSYLQLAGMWCIELAELDALGRFDTSRIKSFLSSSVDRYRLPYGHRALDVPRSTVFLGTVNHGAYLRDETGNRRFWPVRCGRIDLDVLRRDRDQLWAEAVARFDDGAAWWVDSADLARLAEKEQADRYEGEAWDSEIAAWARLRDTISVAEVLADCLKKDRALWSQTDSNRVARSLRSMGWERYRARSGDTLEWRYRRVEA